MTLTSEGIKMEHLISKYLREELTEAEAAELKVWLEKDSLNRKVFENIVGEWRLSQSEMENAKDRIFQNIIAKEINGSPYQVGRRTGYTHHPGRIAAVLALALGLTFITLKYTGIFKQGDLLVEDSNVLIEKEAAYGQKLAFELPDGSIVKLNSGSKLVYPKEFSDGKREVTLTGEGFFDVKRDESRPFRIVSEMVNVQVLGTSFSVRSYPGDTEVTVAVMSGKVAVSDANEEKVLLVKEEMVLYESETGQFLKKTIKDPQAIFGWTDQTLIFRDQEIDEILEILSRWYDVEFQVEKELKAGKEFTAKYKNPSLKAVMESLSYAYDFNYELDGKRVTIK